MLGGRGAGVPPPKYAKSVKVHNGGDHEVEVVCEYDNHKDGSVIREVAKVAPGCTHHFEEKTLDMGSWKAVAPVKGVSTAGGHNLAPSVHGVVNALQVNIKPGGLLEQGASE